MRVGASVAAAVVALITLAAAVSASAGLADRVGATFSLMADDFIKTSQPVDGTVVGAAFAMRSLSLTPRPARSLYLKSNSAR